MPERERRPSLRSVGETMVATSVETTINREGRLSSRVFAMLRSTTFVVFHLCGQEAVYMMGVMQVVAPQPCGFCPSLMALTPFPEWVGSIGD
jgi:hypothetical protein